MESDLTYEHQTLAGHGFPFLVLHAASSHVHCDERCTFEAGWSEPAGMRWAKRVFQCNGLALMPLSHTGYLKRTHQVTAVWEQTETCGGEWVVAAECSRAQ